MGGGKISSAKQKSFLQDRAHLWLMVQLFHLPLEAFVIILASCPWSFPDFRAKGEEEDEARGSVVALVWRRADDPTVVESVPDRS